MNDFMYYNPVRVHFGADAMSHLPEELGKFGANVLLTYGGGSIKRTGLYDRVLDALRAAGKSVYELSGIMPNPRTEKVYEGIELCRREGVDFILAVGGGSVIDSAKAIGYGMCMDGDVWELYNHTRRATGCLPIGVILTIAASGSEMSDSSVITKEEGGIKRGYNDDICRPKFAIMNPELTMTLPDYQTACGCTDILMHTMERYFVNSGTMELTDALAEGLLRTVMHNAEVLHTDPRNYDARAEVMWASSLAHNGLTGCGSDGGDWMPHLLEHEMGGMFNVTHGAGLAAVWPSWARYVYKDCLPRFVKYAVNVMGVTPCATDEETALAGIAAMEEFYHRIGMPVNFKELGIDPTDEQMAEMAASCARACGGAKGSAKVLHQSDMEAIYKMLK